METMTKPLLIDEKEVRKLVIQVLKEFKALRIAMKNKLEIEAEGIENIFPTSSPEDKKNQIKYLQIKRAISEALDEVEREIIERKYLGPSRVKDIAVYTEMGIQKNQYYTLKKQAFSQLATALRIA